MSLLFDQNIYEFNFYLKIFFFTFGFIYLLTWHIVESCGFHDICFKSPGSLYKDKKKYPNAHKIRK